MCLTASAGAHGIAHVSSRKTVVVGGIPDVDRAARTFLDDFRKGRLGRIMLDPILLGEKEELHAATMHFSQRAPPI